jgi:hypothetical protein
LDQFQEQDLLVMESKFLPRIPCVSSFDSTFFLYYRNLITLGEKDRSIIIWRIHEQKVAST